MTPAWVNPARLQEVWGRVRPGLEAVHAKGQTPWIPEDVYLCIKQQQADLWLVGDGFVVTRRIADWDGPTLLVWIIHGSFAAIEQELYAWLREIRARGGFRRVWWQGRKGWARRPGVRLKEYVYELE